MAVRGITRGLPAADSVRRAAAGSSTPQGATSLDRSLFASDDPAAPCAGEHAPASQRSEAGRGTSSALGGLTGGREASVPGGVLSRRRGGVCAYCGGPATLLGCSSAALDCRGKAGGRYWIDAVPGAPGHWIVMHERAHRVSPMAARRGPMGRELLREAVRELRGHGYRRAR